jgi:branched-chain amino acid transport system permease protein
VYVGEARSGSVGFFPPVIAMAWQLFAEIIMNGLLEGAMYSLLAVGMTLIFGVMRVLNIAHGDLAVLGAYISYWMLVLFRIDPFVSLIVVIPISFVLGWAIQRFMINPAISIPQFQIQASYIITYGIALFIGNSELIVWGADYRSLTSAFVSTSVTYAGITLSVARVIAFGVAIIVSALFTVFLRTRLGLAMRASIQDRRSVILMGVDFKKLAGVTFGLSASIAAVAGILYGIPRLTYPALGLQLTLKAVTVMILGGIGSFGGAFIAGLMLGVSESVVSYTIGATYAQLVSFVLLIVILLVKPTGIGGKKELLSPV